MAIGNREAPRKVRVDLIAKDRHGRAVLLAEVRARPGIPEDADQLRGSLMAANAVIPFGMIVDRERIRLYRWDGSRLSGPLFEAETSPILSFYDEEFGTKRIFDHFLTTLVDVWLSDLVSHWKSVDPPAAEAIAATGLLDELDGLSTEIEAMIGGHPVP